MMIRMHPHSNLWRRKSAQLVAILFLGLCVSPAANALRAQCLESEDPLDECIKRAAAAIVDVDDGNVDKLSAFRPEIILYAVIRALTPEQPALGERGQVAAAFMGETARTDKQIGASTNSAGSTTLVENPGLPLFLAYALENGAIQQEVSGTTVTLSGSLYGLMLLASREEDTAKNFERFSLWRRLSTSVTFNLEDTESTSLGDLKLKQVSEYAFRVRILGDRSTRSSRFTKMWRKRVQPHELVYLTNLTGEMQALLNAKQDFLREMMEVFDALKNRVRGFEKQGDAALPRVKELIEDTVRTSIIEPIQRGEISLSEDEKKLIRERAGSALEQARQALARAGLEMDKLLEEFNHTSLLTFAYTNHRRTDLSDYSEFKLLFERPIRLDPLAFDFVSNAGISLYNNPDPARNQSRVRDFHVSISFEGTAKSPFRRADSNDLSKVTYSFSGRYQKMKETRFDIGIAQFKVELPITMGLSLPFSVTYANRTEFNDEDEVRGNFGLSFDLDKLYALTRNILKQ